MKTILLLLAIFIDQANGGCLNATLDDTENSKRYAEFVPDGQSAVLSCGYEFTSNSMVKQLSQSSIRNCTSANDSKLCGPKDLWPSIHSANWFFQSLSSKLEPVEVRSIIPEAEFSDSNLVLRVPQVNASLYGVYTCAVYVRANASSNAEPDGSGPCECYIMRKGLNLFGRVRGGEELARDAVWRLVAALISSGVFIALASGACLVYTFRYKPPKAVDQNDGMPAPGEKNVAYELDAPAPNEEPQETSNSDGGDNPPTEEASNDKETPM